MVDSLGRAALVVGCLLLVVSLPAAGAASGVTLSVDAPGSAAPGDEVTVSVTASAETPLYGIQYTLSFDAESLSVKRVAQGTFFSDEGASLLLAKEADDSTGQVEYGETRQGTETGITGNGTVTRITFVVDENPAAEEVQFTLADVKASDPDGQPIETTTRTATLAIGDSDGTTTGGGQSTATETDGPTATDRSTAEPWRQKLTTTLEQELAESDVVPVIVVVADSADLAPVADALEQQGGDDVETLASIHAVAAVVDHDALAAVAKRSDVERIRYDSRVSVNTTTETSPTATGSETTTPTPTESATPTASPDDTPSAATETSTSADGFGVVSSVLGLLTLLVYLGRKPGQR